MTSHRNHLQDSGADIYRATPAQLAAHRAHVARRDRIRSARIVETVHVKPKPEAASVPKPLWFGIVEEIELPGRKITAADIKRAVAAHFNTSVLELISDRRNTNVMLPRQIAMHLTKEMTPLSTPQIGRYFGGRDHTTVLYAFNKIEGLLRTDEDLAATIATIRESITWTK